MRVFHSFSDRYDFRQCIGLGALKLTASKKEVNTV
jgi:hypothetical protein